MSKENAIGKEFFRPAEDANRPREVIGETAAKDNSLEAASGRILEPLVQRIKSGDLLREWAALPYLDRERVRVMVDLFGAACAAVNFGDSVEGHVLSADAIWYAPAGKGVYDDAQARQEFLDLRDSLIEVGTNIQARGILATDDADGPADK